MKGQLSSCASAKTKCLNDAKVIAFSKLFMYFCERQDVENMNKMQEFLREEIQKECDEVVSQSQSQCNVSEEIKINDSMTMVVGGEKKSEKRE